MMNFRELRERAAPIPLRFASCRGVPYAARLHAQLIVVRFMNLPAYTFTYSQLTNNRTDKGIGYTKPPDRILHRQKFHSFPFGWYYANALRGR